MSVKRDTGVFKYWIYGEPVQGLGDGVRDTGTLKYWIYGEPEQTILLYDSPAPSFTDYVLKKKKIKSGITPLSHNL